MNGSPLTANQSDFPVTPGAEMPKVDGCNKLDYAVLFVIGKEDVWLCTINDSLYYYYYYYFLNRYSIFCDVVVTTSRYSYTHGENGESMTTPESNTLQIM